MFYSSLKTKRVFNADIMGLPKEPTFSNYQKIMTNADYHIGQSKSVIFCGQFNTYLSFSLPAPAFSLNPTLPLDRKSTRLNSSHP